MNIRLNGDEREIHAGATVRSLLAELKLAPERVAIELNRRLVRAAQYDQVLNDGDSIEIVTFVGGG